MRLALKLEQDSDGAIVPRMIVGKLRTLCQAHGFAVVDQATGWVFRHGREHLPGPSTRDFGRVFSYSLENVVAAYATARDERAAELGVDAAGFDLYEHLNEERERAEREAAAQQAEAVSRQQEREEAAQRAAQECQEIRTLMETLVPHAAVVLHRGRSDGEQHVRERYLTATDTSSGKWRHIRDDDLAGWKRKAMRLAKDFGNELSYAEEAHPGDSDLVLARKFYDELVADHAWLTA